VETPVAKQPRKHHQVPQFYLAGFTKSDSKDGDLYVLDKKQRKIWISTPTNTAHKRDFHKISVAPDVDPMAIEKALGQLEGRWSAVLKSVIETQAIPDGEPFAELMMFVAFMAVRVPRIREMLSNFIDRVSKTEIQLMFHTKEAQADFRKALADLGRLVSDAEFEELVRFAQSGEYEVNFEQTWHVQEMVEMASTLAPALSLRNWCLWIAEESAPDLICSDNPVAPTWAIPVSGWMSPAFGTRNTIVSVPVNRRIVLVSMIERDLPQFRLDRDGIAAVNSMTATYANQLYSSEPDFVWRMNDDRVGNVEALLDALVSQGK
jgi:hypothetical protein